MSRARLPFAPMKATGDLGAGGPAADDSCGGEVAVGALTAVSRHLDRCKLAAPTVRAYKQQATVYAAWLAANANAHGDAFADLVGTKGAVTAWKRDMITARSSQAAAIDAHPNGAGR